MQFKSFFKKIDFVGDSRNPATGKLTFINSKSIKKIRWNNLLLLFLLNMCVGYVALTGNKPERIVFLCISIVMLVMIFGITFTKLQYKKAQESATKKS